MSKNIKISLIISFLALFAASAAQSEGGSEALDDAWQSRFQEAEWVAKVRVESVNSLVNPALSAEAGLMAIQGYSYALSVTRQWKTTSGDGSAKLRIDLSDCPVLLTLDSDYLVFASRNYRGQWQLRSCDHVVHDAEAAPVISWLDALDTAKQAAAVEP